ncbi:hypothetical protein M8J76_011875 [Diaphorina citri]|nr:hypothetical protein M8J75_008070 [Diaphorina citri]KAI5730263.1 hypothetical protein M8J76_011875 [Diaphorina citri]KAI5735749.1 hypothetical protein M8J77_022162 [Diaphorina citri]
MDPQAVKDMMEVFQQKCSLLNRGKAPYAKTNTERPLMNVERSQAHTCLVHKSSSIYHKHPEWNPKKFVFKAKPVPKHIYSRFDRFLKTSRTPYVTVVKPFSFHERDQDIEKKKEERMKRILEAERKQREYHARPVPTWVYRYTVSTPEFRTLQNYFRRIKPTTSKTKPSARNSKRELACKGKKSSVNFEAEEQNQDEAVPTKDSSNPPSIAIKSSKPAAKTTLKDGVMKDKKPDRKAMLIRSKAEQNISIKSDLKKSKSTLRPSVKFSQRVSAQEIACKVSRSDDTQVIAQQKSVPNQKFDKAQEQIGNKSSTNQKYENSHGQIGHKSATNQKVDNAHQQIGHKYATNQKFELKKKPNIVKPVQKQKPHRKVPNKSVSSMKLPPIQSVKQAPKNSAELLTTNTANVGAQSESIEIKADPNNSDYDKFYKELKIMQETLTQPPVVNLPADSKVVKGTLLDQLPIVILPPDPDVSLRKESPVKLSADQSVMKETVRIQPSAVKLPADSKLMKETLLNQPPVVKLPADPNVSLRKEPPVVKLPADSKLTKETLLNQPPVVKLSADPNVSLRKEPPVVKLPADSKIIKETLLNQPPVVKSPADSKFKPTALKRKGSDISEDSV